MLAIVHAALPAITMTTSEFRHRCARAEPADQRRVGDQEQAGFAQQRLRQIEQRGERAGAKGAIASAPAPLKIGIGEQGAAQELGWTDHDGSPWLGAVELAACGTRRGAGAARRNGQSVLPTLFSTACTWANTNAPVECTSGSGMLRLRARSRVASLSNQGTSPAARERKRKVLSWSSPVR